MSLAPGGCPTWPPWLTGFRQSLFRNDLWQYVDIDVAMRDRLTP